VNVAGATQTPRSDAPPGTGKRTLSRSEFEHFSPMIRRQAMILARKAPRSVTVSDLCARGFAGLFAALVSFEAVGGTDLDDYVALRVRTAMLDHLIGLDPAVREARFISRRIARGIKSLAEMLGRAPERTEIAAVLEMAVEDYEAALALIHVRGLARIEVLGFDQPESIRSEDEAPLSEGSLARAIASIDEASRELLGLLYQEDCKMGEAAAVMGLSESRASILFTEAMHRLRAALGRE